MIKPIPSANSGSSKVFALCIFLIFSGLRSYGQTDCDCPAISSCGPCVGGLSSLVLEYTVGGIIISVSASDEGGALAGTTILSGVITINSRVAGEPYDGDVTVSVPNVGLPNVTDSETFGTTCSNPA